MTLLEKAGVIMAIAVPVVGAFVFMIRKMWKAFKRWVKIEVIDKLHEEIEGLNRKIDKIDADGQDRAEENALMFEGTYKIIEAIQTGEANGNLTKIKKKMDDYLRSKIYPRKENNHED